MTAKPAPTVEELHQTGIKRLERWLKRHPECDRHLRLMDDRDSDELLHARMQMAQRIANRLSFSAVRQLFHEHPWLWSQDSEAAEGSRMSWHAYSAIARMIEIAMEKWQAKRYTQPPPNIEHAKTLEDLAAIGWFLVINGELTPKHWLDRADDQGYMPDMVAEDLVGMLRPDQVLDVVADILANHADPIPTNFYVESTTPNNICQQMIAQLLEARLMGDPKVKELVEQRNQAFMQAIEQEKQRR